ncbi:MAG TPA: Fic family protein [Candidatus Dormibacteraeota bacterium]|nr:Fic family protein [Candidatus Dormibacteraeota bacterium]
MEPLLPKEQGARLADLTCQVLKAAGALLGQVHSPLVLKRAAELVREMNCYYSNLIEGHKTLPRDIERAMQSDFSPDHTQRDNQHLSLAHIAVEKLMEERLAADTAVDVYAPDFLCWLHREFYTRLPEPLHWATTKTGERYRLNPGSLRDFMVEVGRHTPPDFEALPKFLDRFHTFYRDDKILETSRLLAIAAAHHRLAWIHPFGDGNGRVIRLHSQALFIRHGISSHGLWTLSRGLARGRQRYYASLEAADQRRRNDFDGRGNLSDRALADFCVFFLETMLDQIQFMSGLLDLPALRTRVERYFQFQDLRLKRYREQLMRVVRVLVDEGEIPRSRVQEITGKAATVSAEIIKLGLDEGYFETPSPKGPLRVSFPAKIHEFYFPQLFLDLPVEPPAEEAA